MGEQTSQDEAGKAGQRGWVTLDEDGWQGLIRPHGGAAVVGVAIATVAVEPAGDGGRHGGHGWEHQEHGRNGGQRQAHEDGRGRRPLVGTEAEPVVGGERGEKDAQPDEGLTDEEPEEGVRLLRLGFRGLIDEVVVAVVAVVGCSGQTEKAHNGEHAEDKVIPNEKTFACKWK